MMPSYRQEQGPAKSLCWLIQAVETPGEADVYIFDHIGLDTPAADFVKELNALDVRFIRVHINSYGGFVDDGLAIYNALLQHPATLEVRIESVAASAASFVAMAGNTIKIAETARITIHDATIFVAGSASFLHDVADFLDRESANIASVYAKRTDVDAAVWRTRMKARNNLGTTYQGKDAIAAGLADELLEAPPKESDWEPLRAAAIEHTNKLARLAVHDLDDLGVDDAQESPTQVIRWRELPPEIDTTTLKRKE